MGNEKIQSERIKSVAFTLLGVILGAVVSYLLTIDQQRINNLREIRKTAYIDFLNAQVLWDIGSDRDAYEKQTATARKKIAIYGNKEVVKALAQYWRNNFQQTVICDSTQQKTRDDVAIYQSMRMDIMRSDIPIHIPILMQDENISNEDMMMLIFFCRYAEKSELLK
jgi:hypothetical protein